MSVVTEQMGSLVLVEDVCVLKGGGALVGENGGRAPSCNCIPAHISQRKKMADNLSQCLRKVLETHLCVDLVS